MKLEAKKLIFTVDGVNVIFADDLDDATREEAQNYVDYIEEHADTEGELAEIFVSSCNDGSIDLHYKFNTPKFERIRRITGYLVGTLDRWNDSKRAEERDRVKHGRFD